MLSPLVLASCLQLVAGAGLRSVARGKLVLPLAAGCKKGSFRLGPQSHLLLESANLNTAYGDNLDCKARIGWFVWGWCNFLYFPHRLSLINCFWYFA